MKKVILVGSYFALMIGLSILVARTISVYGSPSVEYKIVEHEHTLDDTEIINSGIVKKKDSRGFNMAVVKKWTVKETRVKKGFGWETKKEIIVKPGTYYEE